MVDVSDMATHCSQPPILKMSAVPMSREGNHAELGNLDRPTKCLSEVVLFPPTSVRSPFGGRLVYANPDNPLKIKTVSMVEAAGVEPASENVVSKEPTYLVTFMRRC